MTDRIDKMTHDECREVLRKLKYAWDESRSDRLLDHLRTHFKTLDKTPIDRLREFLEKEGWEMRSSFPGPKKIVSITDVGYYNHPDWK